MISTWPQHQVAAGTVVYHVTEPSHAINIGKNGIQQVANAFGGGRLGQGFYTHTNAQSAGLYYQGSTPVTLQMSLTRDATGQIAPQNVYVADLQGNDADYLTGNDFITAEEDHDELKFHGGDCLQLDAIWQGGTQFSVQDWLGFADDSDSDDDVT
jgi:hypothetical protein